MLEIRFDSYDPDRGIIFLEPAGDAHGRPRGAQGQNRHRDLAFGLAPDFLARALVVGGDVVGIVELIRSEILFRMLAHEVVDNLDRAIRAEDGGRQNQFRPEGAQNLLALFARRFRHGQAESITLGGRGQGQADAGVSARRLQDDLVFRQLAAPFRAFDHGQGDPILDGASRIEALNLGEDLHARIGVQVPDLHKRRISDRLDEA